MAFGHRGHDGSLWSVQVGGSTLRGRRGLLLTLQRRVIIDGNGQQAGSVKGRLTFVKKDPGLARGSPPGRTSPEEVFLSDHPVGALSVAGFGRLPCRPPRVVKFRVWPLPALASVQAGRTEESPRGQTSNSHFGLEGGAPYLQDGASFGEGKATEEACVCATHWGGPPCGLFPVVCRGWAGE